MPIVGMPDGTQVQFPDDMPAERIKGLIAQKFPDAAKEAGRSIPEQLAHTFVSQPGSDYADLVREATGQMGEGASQTARGIAKIGEGKVSSDLGIGPLKTAAGALGYVTAPINAALRTTIGRPAEAVTGIPKEYPEFAASFALPIPKRIGVPSRAPQPIPPNSMGVTLSEGQATGELPLIQREQAALRGQSGPPAQKAAQEFAEQQKAQLVGARENVAQTLDPGAQVITDNPQAAGDLVQRSVQQTAAMRKAQVDAAYREARSYPGEIHAAAFESMPQKIKGELSLRDEPIIIDDKLTPFASRAIQDIENRVGRLQIQNRADPFGQPNPENIVGVDLKGVDQMRKRLSTFRKDAYASGNAADGRAAKAVLDAFDDRIDAAVNGGLFKGDQRAVDAWNTARAAYSDYRSTFTAGKNDPVGRVVEKIIGKGNNPAAIPNDVADFMYGAAGVNPNSLNVGVVNRVKGILGDRSPEWSSVKQGLFQRLSETPEGVKDFGPGKVADRISRFLNGDGKEMAQALYAPHERALLQSYADLMRRLEIPQAGANWSNTATFAGQGYRPDASARILSAIGSNVGAAVAAAIGHASHYVVGGLPFGAAEAGAAATAKVAGLAQQQREARAIAKQMPIIANLARGYSAASAAYETSKTARNVARLTLATRNLATNLKDIGVDFEGIVKGLQGPARGGAEQEQPQP